MRLITKAVFKYDELSESAKQKAIEQYADIQVDYHWWETVYDDAERVGLKISQFDTYRRTIDITYQDDPEDVAKAILKEWGEGTVMYSLADYFLASYNELKAIEDDEEQLYDDDDMIALNNDFLHSLGEEFLSILIRDYEWRTSEESIAECIEANDFEFYENGTRY